MLAVLFYIGMHCVLLWLVHLIAKPLCTYGSLP